jgi:hypothetical protein
VWGEFRAVYFNAEGNEPRISLPHLVVTLDQDAIFVVHSADHQKFMVGVSVADPELPPIKVLAGWGRSVP